MTFFLLGFADIFQVNIWMFFFDLFETIQMINTIDCFFSVQSGFFHLHSFVQVNKNEFKRQSGRIRKLCVNVGVFAVT